MNFEDSIWQVTNGSSCCCGDYSSPDNLLGRQMLGVHTFASSISVFIWFSFMASGFAHSN